MKHVLTVIKFVMGIISVGLFFYRNSLFAQFARDGTSMADAAHRVLVNNHGSFSYITSEQSTQLRNLVVGSAALFGVAAILDIVQRTVLKSLP